MKKWMVDGRFKALSDAEKAELPTEDLAIYVADKNTAENEARAEKLQTQIDSFGESLKGYAAKEDVDNRYNELKERADKLDNAELKEQIEKLQDSVNKQGLDLKKRNENVNQNINKSVYEQIHSYMKEKASNLGEFKKSDRKDVGLVINMKATVTRPSITDDTMAFRVPGVGQIQRRKIFLEELFTSGRVSANNHGVIRYTDQQALTNNANNIAEGAAYPESDITWIEKNIPIEKIGDSIKVSREMMDDVDFVTSEINNYLLRNVALKVDSNLLKGDGTTPNLVGLITSATAFVAGGYAATVEAANIYDLIAVVAAQIQTNADYIPTGVLMNQIDAVRMNLEKDLDENYLIPTFVVPTENGEITIAGMKVVVNSNIVANTMYVGDFTRGTVYSSDDLQLEMGYENDDFTKDLVTIKARRRLALLIRSVDTGAFTYVSDIDAAVTAITAV